MKLSDALRGAADRAPVEELRVSAADAAGRVKRDRRLRMGANGLVGAGAAAIVAVGAMGPIGASMSSADAMSAPAMDAGAEVQAEAEALGSAGDMAAGDTRLAEQWMCGMPFDPEDGSWTWGDTSGVALTAAEPEQVDGAQVEIAQTLEVSRAVDLISPTADSVVTWDGIVVGRAVSADPVQYGPADEPMLPEGVAYERVEPGTLERTAVLDLVNCWDGQPLPAADYEIHQAWTVAYADSGVDASAAPVEPSAVPEPGDGTSSSPVPGAAEGSAGAESGEVEILPVPPMAELVRVAAEPATLTIDGDQVEDPFADYLGGDIPPVPLPSPIPGGGSDPLPEGYLTPDIARQMFEDGVVNGAWDMAAGSQRWVKQSDSAAGDDDWSRNYFGCSWDGTEGMRFPDVSAEMSLLDIEVDVPSSIGVSYGFVVDDNPLVTASVTNISDYTIPGLWGTQPQLYLVRDGQVVAEGFPTSVSQDGMMAITAEEPAILGGADIAIAPANGGALAPEQSMGGQYLWRDVSGCYSEMGRNEVSAGIYTVLSMQSISVSNEQFVAYEGDTPSGAFRDDEGSVSNESMSDGSELGQSEPGQSELGEPEPAIAIAPAPGQVDWLELQAWTSLGTITVSDS